MTWNGVDISWSLKFREKQASLTRLDSSAMRNFTHTASGNMIICRWKGHRIIGDKFTVTIIWKNDGSLLSGTIEWRGGNVHEIIEEVCFPVVNMPWPQDGKILNSHGYLIKLRSPSEPAKSSLLDRNGGLRTQYSALISPVNCYYFDTRDTEFYRKSYEYHAVKNPSGVRYTGIHTLPLDGRSCLRYKIPYRSSIGVFNGSWFEAAQIYKKWALQQKWARRPPVDRRLRDIGMWVWNRGMAEDVIKPAEKLQKDAGVPVALDWYWWHQNGYDTSYPFYWPPREGLAAFKQAVTRLRKQGIFTQVYVNGLTWDMDAEHWEKGGKQSAVIKCDGEVMAMMFNIFAGRRLAWMCGQDNLPFRKKIGATVNKLRKAGLPGVYLDMIGCASYLCCYNQTHSHAPGGGNYQVRGYRKMLKDIIRNNPGLPLSTEEPNEAYMDLFDSAISLMGGNERLGGNALYELVPAFSAVYHGIIAMFGNYALPDSIPPFDPKWPEHAAWKKEKEWHKLYPDQFFVEVARTVVWGFQPTVANLRLKHAVDKSFKEIYDFIVRTARFYHLHRDFLFDGEMMPPGDFKTEEIEVAFLQRFIFTQEGKQTVLRKKIPAVLHSLWRAPDGRTGLVMANYSRETRKFEFSGSKMTASGEIPPRSWMLIERSCSTHDTDLTEVRKGNKVKI
jgi:hypothetical protein